MKARDGHGRRTPHALEMKMATSFQGIAWGGRHTKKKTVVLWTKSCKKRTKLSETY